MLEEDGMRNVLDLFDDEKKTIISSAVTIIRESSKEKVPLKKINLLKITHIESRRRRPKSLLYKTQLKPHTKINYYSQIYLYFSVYVYYCSSVCWSNFIFTNHHRDLEIIPLNFITEKTHNFTLLLMYTILCSLLKKFKNLK